MKRFFTPLITALLLASCISEKSTSPGKATTFIRSYNGGFNDIAQTFEVTSDQGFIILATTVIKTSEAAAARYKIKLIKTDPYGNPVWQKVYPEFTAATPVPNYRASDLQILSGGGYVITGEDIQSNGTSKILVMTVDDNGVIVKNNSLAPLTPGTSEAGQAVAVNAVGNYLVLGTSGNTSMILTELKKSDLTPIWTNTYSAGQVTLADRLFVDDTGKAFWSGTVVKSGITGIRVIKIQQNSQSADFDQFLIQPGFSEEASDFARFGFGYAIIGSTNQKAGTPASLGDKDILFKRLGQDGSVLSTQSFPLGDKDTQNDTGNSISSTQDGGLILLASVNSVAIDGNGDDDYYMIKINAFGDKEWTSSFGSRFKDTGVAVRQASDGGYLVLGTSFQGGQDIIVLTKTDKSGKVE